MCTVLFILPSLFQCSFHISASTPPFFLKDILLFHLMFWDISSFSGGRRNRKMSDHHCHLSFESFLRFSIFQMSRCAQRYKWAQKLTSLSCCHCFVTLVAGQESDCLPPRGFFVLHLHKSRLICTGLKQEWHNQIKFSTHFLNSGNYTNNPYHRTTFPQIFCK